MVEGEAVGEGGLMQGREQAPGMAKAEVLVREVVPGAEKGSVQVGEQATGEGQAQGADRSQWVRALRNYYSNPDQRLKPRG